MSQTTRSSEDLEKNEISVSILPVESSGSCFCHTKTPGGHSLQTRPTYQERPIPNKMASPTALGLFAFSMTTGFYGLIRAGAGNLGGDASVVVAPAIAFGGSVQLIAGILEFFASPNGSNFGGTASASYGAFWLSFALISSPYVKDPYNTAADYDRGVGLFLAIYALFSGVIATGAMRQIRLLGISMSIITLSFGLFSISSFSSSVQTSSITGQIGGVTTTIASILAFFTATSLLLQPLYPEIRLPIGIVDGPKRD